MTKCNSSIGVIGAGSYGTALAITLARNHNQKVLLWSHNQQSVIRLQADRCNTCFLPNIYFPDNLIPEFDLVKVLQNSRDLLVVVPSHVFGDVLIKCKPHLRLDSRIVWATKGLEKQTGRLLQEVAREILGNNIPLAVISGPTFAQELAQGLPTSIVLASTDTQFAKDLHYRFQSEKYFHIYNSSDIIGIQIGGAVKNVIAIGAGISDGIGFGANARTALIICSLVEISKLGVALGADSTTFMGMAGLGDLLLTCTDDKSRNRRFGIMLGQGKSVNDAKCIIGQIVEGYRNTKEVKALANRAKIEMPIVEQIYQVLYFKKSAREAALSLINHK
ncbi:NAD(P)H-dependent glycerol-3-phosphate dehydrogenase [Pantoea sp. Aalb]|uniref:NAD(P)H-dependent glycerol-3-phosphate dehydrogenase n=1 Tax=Pantoea sp. Aalb TaxID=2576762 RepID=UPI00132C339F|nr:NAD(P)H-dependent glycerol-3-phosphate dehydrogenase [Pantoea sp. Aalb]MXP67932.1 NAD(P)H-dependent glycerol-3-phosphate dehydrogenase [Pantoea sp. Aalb]